MADRSISYEFRAKLDGFRAQLAAGGRSVDDFGKKLMGIDRQGADMRRALTGVGDIGGKIGLAAAGGLAAAAKAAIDWESAWAGVMKTTDLTGDSLDKLEGDLREMARTMPATHQEIAAVAEAAGQLGVAGEDVAEFTKTMVMLGETTNLTADEAATSIAQMANVMGTAPEDIDNLGAALVALGNDGASTERDIVQMAQRISGAGAQIGLTEPKILAIANATASMGIEVEAGGTAISRVFTELAKAVATGGPNLETFAETAGLTADEFGRLFKESPEQAFAAFTGGLDRINKSGGNVFGTLKALGLSDVRVSDALLRMAASGDLLTESLDLGNEAWEESTALTDEFAKRAGTTAAEMQVAWNNVKDAAIDVGAATLPVLGAMAETVSFVAQSFGSLPQPVKGATAGLLGITAILGGGLWFTAKTVSGIANMRENLATLGIQAGGARTRLAALNTLKFAGLLTALKLLDSGMESAFKTRINQTDLERNLTALANGKVSDDLKRIGEDLLIVADGANKAAEPIQETIRLGGLLGDTPLDKAAANIEAVDQALASMVEGGKVAEAREIYNALLEVIWEEGGNQREAIKQFDAFATAIDNSAAAADESADAQDKAAGATKNMGDATANAIPVTEKMEKALQEARDGALETAGQFVNLGESLNDPKVSLREWIRELEAQGRALREFQRNAETAARKGLDEGLVKSLNEAGTEGAMRLDQLAGASEKDIARANKAWRNGQRATNNYADTVEDLLRKLMGLPPVKRTEFKTPGLNAAITAAQKLVAQLAKIRDKHVSITATYAGINKPRSPLPGEYAEGGFVPKTGLPYADRHHYLLADGEGVTTNRRGETDRFRDVISGINAGLSRSDIKGMLADGGFAGRYDRSMDARPISTSSSSAAIDYERLGVAVASALRAQPPHAIVGKQVAAEIVSTGQEVRRARS